MSAEVKSMPRLETVAYNLRINMKRFEAAGLGLGLTAIRDALDALHAADARIGEMADVLTMFMAAGSSESGVTMADAIAAAAKLASPPEGTFGSDRGWRGIMKAISITKTSGGGVEHVTITIHAADGSCQRGYLTLAEFSRVLFGRAEMPLRDVEPVEED